MLSTCMPTFMPKGCDFHLNAYLCSGYNEQLNRQVYVN